MTFYKRTGVVLVAGLLLVLALLMTSPQVSAGSDWSPAADKIEAALNQALDAYKSGDREKAGQLAKDAPTESARGCMPNDAQTTEHFDAEGLNRLV